MIAEAVRKATAEIQRQPDSAAAWGELGMILYAHEINAEAAACLAQAQRLDPTDARWPYLQGRCFSQTDPHKSIELFEQAVAVCGNVPDAPRLRLVETLLESQQLDRAEQHLDTYQKQFPHSARASHARARLRFMRGDYQGCLDELLAFDDFISRSHEAERAKAQQLAAQGRLPQAEQVAVAANKQLKKHQRRRKTVGLLMSNALRQLGRNDEAEQRRKFAEQQTDFAWLDAFEDQARKRQTGVKTLLVKADRLYGAGKYAETVTLLRDVVRKYPDSLYAHILLARSLIRQGRIAVDEKADTNLAKTRYEQAQATLNRALRVDQNSVDAQFRMGVVLTYLAELDGNATRLTEAEAWYRRAIQLKPDFTMAHYNLSNVLEKQGRTTEAIDAMRNTIRCQADYVEGLYRLGSLLAKVGQVQEAEQHLTLALKIAPQRKDVQEELDRLLNRR
jgi:tetratricopeptide (TPR) repeat protein